MTLETVKQKPFGCVMSRILVVAVIIITGHSGYTASLCPSYEFYKAKTSWTAARQQCRHQQSGGDLVAMENKQEWEFLKSKVSQFGNRYGARWYIGLEKVHDKWCWITRNASCIEGTVGKWRWNTNEPNNPDTEDCVEMLEAGVYNNVKCFEETDSTGYICEREIDCSTRDTENIIVRRQNSTALKLLNSEGEQTATTKSTTEMMATNPQIQLTTTVKSQDVGKTKTLAATGWKVTKKFFKHSSQSEKQETTVVFNPTTGAAKDTASNQEKKSQWVTIVMIGVAAAILIVLLILLGYIIKRRRVSKKSEGGRPVENREVEAKGNYGVGQLTNDQTHPSESSVPLRRVESKILETDFHFSNLQAGYSSKTMDKNTSCTEDNSPGTSSWSKEHVYDNMFPEERKHTSASLASSGESPNMLSKQGNKTDDQKYIYASVDKKRRKKSKAEVHLKPVRGDLVYAELDFNPLSQDAPGAAAKESPTKATTTVYAIIEETCG